MRKPSNADLARHLRAQRNKLRMTNAVITKVDMRKYNTEFIERIHEACKQDQEWQERKTELRELEQHLFQLPKYSQIIYELIY